MGINVATQNALTELVKDRIGKRIREIQLDGRVDFVALNEQARADTHKANGTAAAAERYSELKKIIAEADREARMINDQLKELYPLGPGRSYQYASSLTWQDGFTEAVQSRAQLLFKNTEAGKEVAALQQAMSDLQLIILTATNSTQLAGLVAKVNEATGYEPSEFEKTLLA